MCCPIPVLNMSPGRQHKNILNSPIKLATRRSQRSGVVGRTALSRRRRTRSRANTRSRQPFRGTDARPDRPHCPRRPAQPSATVPPPALLSSRLGLGRSRRRPLARDLFFGISADADPRAREITNARNRLAESPSRADTTNAPSRRHARPVRSPLPNRLCARPGRRARGPGPPGSVVQGWGGPTAQKLQVPEGTAPPSWQVELAGMELGRGLSPSPLGAGCECVLVLSSARSERGLSCVKLSGLLMLCQATVWDH